MNEQAKLIEPIKFIDPHGPEARAAAEVVADQYMANFATDEVRHNWSTTSDGKWVKNGNGDRLIPVYGASDVQAACDLPHAVYTTGAQPSFTIVGDFPEAVPYPNPSGIHPTEYRVLILPTPYEEVTKGGIIKPPDLADREKFATMDGTIVAVSHLAFAYATDEEWAGRKPKPGDKVIYAKYAGFRRKGKDGLEYVLVGEKDICAVLE